LNRMETFSSPFLLWDDAEKLVRNKPDAHGVERIYNNRGNELLKLKRYNEAMIDFNKAIALYPNFEIAYINRATTFYFLGRYQEALRDYNHAIAINPDNHQPYYRSALTYRALGDFAAAQQDFNKSCALGGLCQ
jgi:tetratricopeptide (TPR) repeat protein